MHNKIITKNQNLIIYCFTNKSNISEKNLQKLTIKIVFKIKIPSIEYFFCESMSNLSSNSGIK